LDVLLTCREYTALTNGPHAATHRRAFFVVTLVGNSLCAFQLRDADEIRVGMPKETPILGQEVR
jgi:hypothetical protein